MDDGRGGMREESAKEEDLRGSHKVEEGGIKEGCTEEEEVEQW